MITKFYSSHNPLTTGFNPFPIPEAILDACALRIEYTTFTFPRRNRFAKQRKKKKKRRINMRMDWGDMEYIGWICMLIYKKKKTDVLTEICDASHKYVLRIV